MQVSAFTMEVRLLYWKDVLIISRHYRDLDLGIREISSCTGKLPSDSKLRCAALETPLYTAYNLGSCVPCTLHLISLDHLFRVS